MRFKKIEYKIHDRFQNYKVVTGYAVDQRDVPVRICVRRNGWMNWVADHYDTGMGIGYFSFTRSKAASLAIRVVREAIKTGQYAKRLAMWERGGL